MPELEGRRVAMVATDGVEQVELFDPREALRRAGAHVDVVAPKGGAIKGWDHTSWGEEIPVDRTLDEADPGDYDALVLPGGVMNPDRLRRDERVQRFVRHFFDEGKPVAAICHGPWTLIDAGVVRGRKVTSYHTLQEDLRNAGAEWSDREVVVDGNLVTSRKPADLPAFDRELIALLAKAPATAATSSR